MRTSKPTDRRPIGRALLAFTAVTAVLVLAGGGSADAAEVPPELTAKISQRGDRVVLRWKFDTESRQRERVLEIERSTGGPFVAAVTKSSPGKTGSVADHTPPTTATSYRARLVVNGQAGAWGPSVTVDPAARATPPTTAPPPTSSPPTPPPGGGVSACPESWDSTVVGAVNNERRKQGLPALTMHTKLATAANERAVETAALRRYDHSGVPAALARNQYWWSWWGENLHTRVSASTVVPGWMASGPHRANILGGNFVHVGVGCAYDSLGAPWWSLVLARGS